MFAYVAGAMGMCTTITQEDAGLFFADTPHLTRPDFHLVTKDGARFFVEVKNYSPNEKHYFAPTSSMGGKKDKAAKVTEPPDPDTRDLRPPSPRLARCR